MKKRVSQFGAGLTLSRNMAAWRNGIRTGFGIRLPPQIAGSSPAAATYLYHIRRNESIALGY